MSPFAAKLFYVCALNAPGCLAAIENNRANKNANHWWARA
jgi:hypothetical protein